ncbi:hypothetical protein GCM10027615_00220 [Plantactinospora veratri]
MLNVARTLLQRRHGGRLRAVALVGIDGSGKTTQAHRLADALTVSGVPATYWQNAGGRRWFGRLARKLGRRDAQRLLGRNGMLLAESVLRWLAIGRALLRSRLRSRVAVMDRYSVCQYASIRAHGGGRRWESLARLLYRIFPPPDITFLLAVDPGEAYRRIEARGTDHENITYLAAGAAAYRSLPESATFVVVDANRSPAEVTRAIQAGVRAWLPADRPLPGFDAAPAGPLDPRGAADPPGTPDLASRSSGPDEMDEPDEAEPATAGSVRPGRTPVSSRRSSAPTRHWPGSGSPRRSPPGPPSGSGPRWAAPPGWPACR